MTRTYSMTLGLCLFVASLAGGCGNESSGSQAVPDADLASDAGIPDSAVPPDTQPAPDADPVPEYDANPDLSPPDKPLVNKEIGPRLDPTGKTVPSTYNPTLRPLTQLYKRSELFAGGIGWEAGAWPEKGKVHAALDWLDNATDFTPSKLSAGDDLWLTLPKTMASGDFDGDGKDEIFVAYVKSNAATFDLAYRIIKRNKATGLYDSHPEVILKAGVSKTEYPDDDWWNQNFNAVAGDLDGNGKSEVILAFNGSFMVLGDSEKSYGLGKTITYSKTDYAGLKLVRVATGDLDNDGSDEVVVSEGSLAAAASLVGNATYHVYKGLALKEVAQGSLASTKDANPVTLRGASCAVGDVDGDGLNEVVFVGAAANVSKTYYVLILQSAWNKTAQQFEYALQPGYEAIPGRSDENHSPLCAVADFDGDGKKDILAHNRIYKSMAKTGGVFVRMSDRTKAIDVYESCWPTLGSHYDNSLAVGDVDGDTKSDVAYFVDGAGELCVLGYNSLGAWVRKGTGNTANTSVNYPYLTMGDYDGDSLTLQFKSSELLFSDPHPIAVLASNPYWEGIPMDGQTSFGNSKSTTKESSKEIGFSVGVTFGYETEGLFDIYSASLKTTFESAFDWTATKATIIEESYTYATYNEDLVVFTTVPYDVYYYTVMHAPDPSTIGKTITVNLPRKPITMPAERTFYNEHNGSAPDIDQSVLSHTLGNPLSYPSKARAAELIAQGGGEGLISSEVRTVGAGGNSTAIDMSMTEEKGTGSSFDISVKIEAEAGAGGFTAGVSAGFHYGESYSITTGEGTLYGGQIGSIPSAQYSLDQAFSWGLFAYRGKVGQEKFVVVQYYTEATH